MKVKPETDDPGRFSDLESVFVGEHSGSATEVRIKSARFQTSRHGTTVLLSLDGIEGREAADSRRGLAVFAREEDLPGLEDGEWYLDDFAGMNVCGSNGHIGVVTEVLELPSHPILAVARPDGREALIPAVAPFVVSVDSEAREIHVELPEGLIED